MKFWHFFYWALIILIPIYLLLKTIYPSIPALSEKVKVCDPEDTSSWRVEKGEGIIIQYCKTFIPLDTLYKANSFTLVIKADQQLDILVQFMNNKDFLFTLNSATLIPTSETETFLTIKLDDNPFPKINRLVKDINTVNIIFSKFDKTKPINAQILNMYLQ